MSLSRFTTRMLACAALMPQMGDTAPITMAENRVFDSRLDPLQFEHEVEGRDIPAIVVYTDDDEGRLVNVSANNGPLVRMVHLRVELTIGAFSNEGTDEQPEYVYAMPTTDAELEAQLDLFEQQVRWALTNTPGRAATDTLVGWVIGFRSVESRPMRDETTRSKVASRILTFTLHVPDDCGPTVGVGAPSPPVQITADMFPHSPWLADMFVAMQQTPSMQRVLQMLARTGQPTIFFPLLQRLGVTFAAGSSGQTEAQRAKVQTEWELSDGNNAGQGG